MTLGPVEPTSLVEKTNMRFRRKKIFSVMSNKNMSEYVAMNIHYIIQ